MALVNVFGFPGFTITANSKEHLTGRFYIMGSQDGNQMKANSN